MKISVNQKTDYSSLFNSLPNANANGAGSSYGINLADYASIKNGSYGKLVKAYYAKNGADDIKEEASTDKTSSLKQVASLADGVNKAADKLLKKGTDSLFNKKEITIDNEDGTKTVTNDYDRNAISDAVKSFADNYNSFINKAKRSSEDAVAKRADSLANMMTVNYQALQRVGIDINDDDTLSINSDRLAKADMNSVKSLFNGNQSLAYQVSAQTSMIGTSATTAANSASGYTRSGAYADFYYAGSMLNGIV